ncbi:MAG TPA: acyl-ACP--UDP-N-acetylglucosamine O-acyltransferase [Bacteroidia bacterium]|jgi:UDP-N-acetylglucosamine acyltransferase|nr:acyl-ACP--UDP-N-acetylglucosamine O-acyltransferase [Bacteroidia bacterium]
MISNLASIHPKAQLGNNVIVEAFVSISGDVIIGDNTWIGPNAVILDGTRIGKGCKIFPGAVIGGIPQDLKYKGENSLAEIGDNSVIREYVTINRGTADRMTTKVGSNTMIMAYTHIAHDSLIGNNVILASYIGITGHVTVEDYAIVEGLSGTQQFITIGAHSFIAGCSQMRKSIPPYIRVAREPLQYIGVNIVGLTRRGFSKETIKNIEDIYRIIFVRGYNMTKALEMVEIDCPETPERKQIVDFIRNEKDGIVKGI